MISFGNLVQYIGIVDVLQWSISGEGVLSVFFGNNLIVVFDQVGDYEISVVVSNVFCLEVSVSMVLYI